MGEEIQWGEATKCTICGDEVDIEIKIKDMGEVWTEGFCEGHASDLAFWMGNKQIELMD